MWTLKANGLKNSHTVIYPILASLTIVASLSRAAPVVAVRNSITDMNGQNSTEQIRNKR
jgi:hypothetical protein